ncbi:MAG: hypothetical protein J6A57_06655 [Ruminococcus sp.]|nr:hypothetical protein [Ruminococcus sp.]
MAFTILYHNSGISSRVFFEPSANICWGGYGDFIGNVILQGRGVLCTQFRVDFQV